MGYFLTHCHDATGSNVLFLDSISKPKDVIRRCMEAGLEGVAVTNHGTICSYIDFINERDALKDSNSNFKIAFGVEGYLIDESEYKNTKNYYHIIIIAKDEIGYSQIKKLTSLSWERSYMDRGIRRIPMFYQDIEAIEDKGHLIVQTACLGGAVSTAILNGDVPRVKWLLNWMIANFGRENVFIELQPNDHSQEQIEVNKKLISISRQTRLPYVISTDAHYLRKEDQKIHEAFLNSREAHGFRETTPFYDYTYIMEEEEIYEVMKNMGLSQSEIKVGLDNTRIVFDKIQDYDFRGDTIVPQRKIPNFNLNHTLSKWYSSHPTIKYFSEGEFEQDRFLLYLIEQGIEDKKITIGETEADRIETELDVLKCLSESMNQRMSAYLNLVQEIVNVGWEVSFVGASRGCFREETNVLMANGGVRAIKDVRAGEYIISHTGNERKVLQTQAYDVSEELFEIKVGGRERFVCTKDHRIFASKVGYCKAPGSKTVYCSSRCRKYETCHYKSESKIRARWIKAEELKKGDYVVTPKFKFQERELDKIDFLKYIPDAFLLDNGKVCYKKANGKHCSDIAQKYTIDRYIEWNEDFAKLLGLFVGNGWTKWEKNKSFPNGFGIAFHSLHKEKIQECVNLIQKVTGLTPSVIYSKFRNSAQIMVYNKPWACLFSSLCGRGSANKKIPEQIFYKKELLKECVGGLIITDGCVDLKGRRFKYSTASKVLQFQIFTAFNLLGYNANIFEGKQRNQKWQTEKGVRITGTQFEKLCKEFCLGVPRVEDIAWTTQDYFEDENYYYNRVISAKSTDVYNGKVYDLTVEKDSSFIVGGNAVHNSAMSFYINYLIGITQISPIPYDVPYWRFLNKASVQTGEGIQKASAASTLADIDLDFSPSKAEELMNKFREHYGEDNVINTLTFKTESLKSAIKTAARGLGITPEEAQTLSSLVPVSRGHVYTLKECEEGNEEQSYDPAPAVIEGLKSYEGLYDTVKKIEGLVSGVSQHASAVYWCDGSYLNYCGLMRTARGTKITSYDYRGMDACRGLKVDILLTDIQTKLMKCMELMLNAGVMEWQGSLRKTYNKYLHPDVLKYDDKEMWKAMSEGKIMNLFQFETQVGSVCIKRTRPQNVMQLAAANAVMRLMGDAGQETPIDRYVRFRNDINEWYKEMDEWGLTKEEQHILEKYLLKKFGNSVEQEDMILLTLDAEISGFSLYEGNKFRKAVSKKKTKDIEKFKKKFFEAADEEDSRKKEVMPE